MTIASLPLAGCGVEEAVESGGDIAPRIITIEGQRASALLGMDLMSSLLKKDALLSLTAPAVGGTTASSLQSLKYFILSIQICKDVTRNGSGFSGTEGCLTIYRNPDSGAESDYSSYNITSAMADQDTSHWIDFMSAESRAQLFADPTALTSDDIGSYNYGLINFMTPIKVTAEFKDSSGTTQFVTKTPTAAEVKNDTPGTTITQPQYVEFDGTRYRSGAAEELTVQNNNGGTILAFMNPFEITQQDIDDGTGVYVDFVFNPDSFATASSSGGTNCTSGIGRADCTTFSVPMGKLAPVPHKAGETIEKEVYLVSDFSNGNDMRIELYYNTSDASKAIMGMDRSSVATASSTLDGTNALPYGYVVDENSSGSVTFYGYNSATNAIDAVELEGLVRRTNGTVTLHASMGGTSTKSYTYVGTEAVSAD